MAEEKHDAQEVKEILGVVSTEIPKLLEAISSSMYSKENAENLAKSVASFYKSMKEAGMDAVMQFLPDTYGFALEDVALLPMGREQVAVACVTLVSPIGEQSYAGSAVVRTNANDSIVRATLDALNRRLGSLTST